MTTTSILVGLGGSGYKVSNSLRFRSSASAYLNRTFGTSTNDQKLTLSFWGKKNVNVGQGIFDTMRSYATAFWFDSSNVLNIYVGSPGTAQGSYLWQSTPVYRDPSAWYHVVINIDTTQATATNRVAAYINGVQITAWTTQQTITQNINVGTSGNPNRFGFSQGTSGAQSLYWDGYFAEVNFVDGQALTPSSFGTYDTNGVWQPINYSGTYGTNGFHLTFGNTTSTTTLGYDTSGNSNNWTTNNISLASGTSFTTTGANSWVAPTGVTSISYLVVAGGGGGGSNAGGGGGAGGLLTGTATVVPGTTYTMTVGGGGPGGAGGAGNAGTQGTASSIAGSGFTTISATGGGAGQPYVGGTGATGGTGGSGGGGGGGSVAGGTGGSATSGQGSSGGSGGTLGFTNASSGGGGGAGAVGGNATTTLAGAGGIGLTSSINGTLTYYSGGGGGGTNGGTPAAGGTGGGGAGASGNASAAGTAGTANTGGGGGGGAGTNGAGGAGGSGIIIINYGNSGTTYDSMTDSPTVSSATVANYATLNPVGAATYASLTSANLKLTGGGSTWNNAPSTIAPTSGKWYYEVTTTSWGTTNYSAASVYQAFVSGNLAGSTSSAPGWSAQLATSGNSSYFNANAATAVNMGSWVAGDICNVAVDISAGKIWFGRNGVWYNISGTTYTNTDVAAGNGYAFNNLATNTPTYMSGAVYTVSGNVIDLNFGQRPFSYTPPTGFIALNTYNLPTPTIANGAQYMAATTYTGTGASLTIANSANNTIGTTFQPDFVWMKGRSGATDHALYDVVRGTTKDLVSNTTAAETTQATGLTAFGSTGFTIGALAKINTSAATYVGWQWLAGNSSGVSNTSGSITSTVSANTTAGFSVVSYTGTGANATVGHGLGVAPNMIIIKNRSSVQNWIVYHSSNGNTGNTYLNLTNAFAADATVFNSTSPTSSVFTISTSGAVNGSTNSLIAYCWSAITGYSAFGSYTGNGSADGPFVYTGFRPRFILIKNTSAVANWFILDTSRDTYNVSQNRLFPSVANAEATSPVELDILSNGFKIRIDGASDPGTNTSGNTYIYAAFAENPLNYSRAR